MSKESRKKFQEEQYKERLAAQEGRKKYLAEEAARKSLRQSGNKKPDEATLNAEIDRQLQSIPTGYMPSSASFPSAADLPTVEQFQAQNPFQNELNLAAQAEKNRIDARTIPTLTKELQMGDQAEKNRMSARETTDNKIDKWLNPNYKLSKEEKKQAHDVGMEKMKKFSNMSPQQRLIYLSQHPEEVEEYNTADKLLTKSSNAASFATGLAGHFTDSARGIVDYGTEKLREEAKKYAGLTEAAAGISQDEFNKALDQNIDNALKPVDKVFNPIEERQNIAETQNPIAYGAGQFGGMAVDYALTNPVFDAVGAGVGLGKAGRFIANQVGQNAQDLLLDTLPTYYKMKREGVSDEEIGKELAGNVGLNVAANLGMGVLGEIPGAISNIRNAKKAPQIDKQTIDLMDQYYKNQSAPKFEQEQNLVNALGKNADNVEIGLHDWNNELIGIPEVEKAVEKADTAAKISNIKNDIPAEPRVALEAKDGATLTGEPSEVRKNFSEIVNQNDIPDADTNITRLGDMEKPEVERITKETVPPDEYRERGFHESSRERGAIPEDVKNALSETDSMNRNRYKVQHNAETENKAIDLFDRCETWDDVENTFNDLLKNRDAAAAPFARRAVTAYSKAGQTESAMRIMDELAKEGTKSGQFTQAMVLGLAKDDPATALHYAQKELRGINEAGAKKFKNWKNIEMTEDEIKAFTDAKPGDEKAIQDAFMKLGKRIEREHPVKVRAQLKEATHIGMLLNPRTMMRNVVANIPTLGMRAAGNRTEAVLQRVGHAFNKEIEVTQSLLGGGKKQRALAKEIYSRPDVQGLLGAFDHKYNETSINSFARNPQMFKGNTPIDKLADKLTGGLFSKNGGLITKANAKLGAEGNNSLMEMARRTTYKLLELGDAPFVKENFVARLASEVKAKKITDASQITDDMIQRAITESLEATYKDPNRLSKLLADFKKNTGLLGEAAVPFSQTLGSIGMRSIEYSPAGVAKAIASFKKGGKEGIEKGIRDLSKAIPGTGMILAGLGLYASGYLTGDYDSDPTIKQLQKRAGFKPFAIHVGDKYYTFDWAQPASVPLIMGISIAQALQSDDENTDGMKKLWEGIKNGTISAADAWFDQSAFQTLAEMLGGGNNSSFGENSIAMNLAEKIIEMPQRLIGSSLGATARVIDTSYRDTYDQTSYGKNYLNQMAAKIPFLSKSLPQSYDEWGQPRMRANSTGEAMFQQYVNPGEYSEEKRNVLDERLQKIYDNYPDKNLFPPKISYTASAGDFSKKLNNEEHSELSRIQGGYNTELVTAVLDDKMFDDLSDESKASVMKDVYTVTRDLAFSDMFGKDPIENNKKYVDAYREKGAAGVASLMAREQTIRQTGLTANESNIDLLETQGKKALQKKAETTDYLHGIDAKYSDKAEQFLDSNPDAKTYLPQLTSNGMTTPSTWYQYKQASNVIPSLNPTSFAKEYKRIDSNGNKSITQDEFITFLNTAHPSESYAQQLKKAYEPYDKKWKKNLSYENGKYVFKK